MKNIFNNLDANAPEHRNSYDLSQRHLFSAKVGQKLPIACFETLPKDYFEVDCLSLVRSMPLNTAAFSRLKCTFDFIFVPYQQLWHGWNQFFLQNDENMSTGDSFSHDQLPYFDVIAFLNTLLSMHIFNRAVVYQKDENIRVYDKKVLNDAMTSTPWGLELYDSFGFLCYENALRLLDLLGYGSYYSVIYGITDYIFDHSMIADEVLSLDFNNSTNITNFLNFVMSDNVVFNDYIWPRTASSLDTIKPEVIDLVKWSYDYLPDVQVNNYRVANRNVNPFRILAYHKAWQDYTMNKRVQSYDPQYFNVDTDAQLTYKKVYKLFSINYDNWEYDMFTGVFTSPQSGDVSLISGSASIIFSNDNNAHPTRDSNAVVAQDTGRLRGWNSDEGSFNHSTLIGPSVYDIKRAEFLQRWKENHLRAGTKGQSQALGQWNTRFRYLSDEYSDFITSFDMVINIDEVINTADNQGDISGKGIGTSSGKFRYEANDAGVIICLLSIKPRAEYDAVMMDKQNTCLEPFDFPSPFFDNLGLEAVPYYLINMFQDYRRPAEPESANIVGYAPRYLPWKTAIDKVHGSMMSRNYFNREAGGGLSIWATPRKELEYPSALEDIHTLFYVNPNVCDTIFASQVDSSQDTDHFVFNTNFLVRVVRNLSVSGMPNWNV